MQRYRILGTDNAYNVYGRTVTTDATQKTLGSLTPPANCTFALSGTIVARRTGGASGSAGDSAVYKLSALYKVVSGTPTLIGSVISLQTAQESQAGWDATFDISGGTIRVRVTGASGNNVEWRFFGEIIRLGGR